MKSKEEYLKEKAKMGASEEEFKEWVWSIRFVDSEGGLVSFPPRPVEEDELEPEEIEEEDDEPGRTELL